MPTEKPTKPKSKRETIITIVKGTVGYTPSQRFKKILQDLIQNPPDSDF